MMTLNDFLYVIADNAMKYFLIAGTIFILFYIVLKNVLRKRKIQQRVPKLKDYLRDTFYSTISIFIFSVPPLYLIVNDEMRPFTKIYSDINQYGYLYAILLFPLLLIMHDTYFYWMHRLMHHPFLFKKIHLIHHKSTNPSPWTAYAFHPFEAVFEVMIFPIMLFTVPMHFIHFSGFFIFSLIYNVYGHLGYELYPKNFNKHWFGKWINTSVCHNLHHEKFHGNYGLYFTIWDRWCKTLREDYDDNYQKLMQNGKNTDQ